MGRSARTNRELWASLLAPSGLLCRKEPGTGHNKNIESAFRAHQRLNIPQRGTIGWFLGIYVFLLVPANYALFKLLRRTIYAWCLCPVLAVVFTFGSYRYDSLSGEDVRMQLRSVVHIAPDSEVVEIISYMSIFSAYTRAYQVEVEGSDFAFSALELKAGIQDEYSNPDILYQAKTEKLNIDGQGAGVISNLKIGARSRRTVIGTGILPVRARIREAFEQSKPKPGTFPGPGAFGTSAETRVYDGPFLPVLVNGERIVPESEQTIFFVRGPQNR